MIVASFNSSARNRRLSESNTEHKKSDLAFAAVLLEVAYGGMGELKCLAQIKLVGRDGRDLLVWSQLRKSADFVFALEDLKLDDIDTGFDGDIDQPSSQSGVTVVIDTDLANHHGWRAICERIFS